MPSTRNDWEKALVVAIQPAGVSDEEIAFSISEMCELAKTASIEVVDRIIQKRQTIDRNSYLGKGKMAEIKTRGEETGATLVIADDELSGLQLRRLEEGIGLPVTDRTSVILDIFSSHASTREGKLQILLARMRYKLIRLAGGYVALSRQRGGIGVKGPGETKIESDRRLLRIKIQDLEEELEKVVQDRNNQRKKRTERFAPLFAMVGYTNAGKSTLLKALTGAQVLICDGLFTTLDPTARRLELPSGRMGILSDTVGFIRKLPHGLVKAFRATLEDVVNSQVVIHVVDISHDQAREHIEAVQTVLRQIEVLDRETIMVCNKTDRVSPAVLEGLKKNWPDAIFLSALTGDGKDCLFEKMDSIMARQYEQMVLELPKAHPLVKELFQNCRISRQEWLGESIVIEAEIPSRAVSQFEAYRKK